MTLSAVGGIEGALVRLVEGHLDALAILAELGSAAAGRDRQVWGVWAAQPDRLAADVDGSRWRLRGEKP